MAIEDQQMKQLRTTHSDILFIYQSVMQAAVYTII